MLVIASLCVCVRVFVSVWVSLCVCVCVRVSVSESVCVSVTMIGCLCVGACDYKTVSVCRDSGLSVGMSVPIYMFLLASLSEQNIYTNKADFHFRVGQENKSIMCIKILFL